MIDFLYNLFKSEDTKTEEQYQEYKKKYGDKIKILQKGDKYAIEKELELIERGSGYKYKFKTPFDYTLEEAKRNFVYTCRGYDFENLPVREV